MNRRAIITLGIAHTFTDMNQGALPAMLPFLMVERHLSYAAAAGLVFAANAISSVVQPAFGQIADRWSALWLVPLGLFTAGLGIALAGAAPTYLLSLLAVILSGIGVAAFHPAAARIVNYAAGEKRATGMSMFTFGGNAGFAIGPLLASGLLLAFGLNGSLLLIIPAAVMAVVLASQLPHLAAFERSYAAVKAEGGRDQWGPFAQLTTAVVSRSIIFYALNTFLPLYWVVVLGQSKAAGGTALTILLTAGALGTLAVGWLADRYGRRPVVLILTLALTPLLLALTALSNVLLATLLLVPLGFALIASASVMVVMGQEYLPNHIGTASGVTLGLAMSIGGITAPVLGWVADSHGLQTAWIAVAFIPLLVAVLVYTLPRANRKAQPLAAREDIVADMAEPGAELSSA